MHVAFVLPRSFPYRGGYENSLLALAQYLVAHGHRATIFTTVADDLEAFWLPGFKTFPEEQVTVDGVAIRRFPVCYNALRRRATRMLGLAPYWRWKAQYRRPSFRVPGLSEALQTIDADLIHIGPLPYNSLMYAGLHAGEVRNIPVVCTPCTHLGEAANDEVLRHYLQSHQVTLLQHCRKVLCMTRIERDRLQTLGIPPDKLAITPFGIDLKSVTGGNPEYLRKRYHIDGPVVLHLGMKAFEKGSETLVEAMKLLWTRGSDAWLVMAGPGLSAFDAFLAKAGSNCPKLLNLPPFAEAEKRDLLASATIVAQPSRVESLGLVLIEAWVNRKPVIAADIAVSRELVTDSGGGIIAPFGDAGQLAAAIDSLLSDSQLREKMGAAAFSTATHYDGEGCWQRISEEFQRLVGR
ncbi:MAG TPA: glycosyltransferase family 4 protein [Terriglobales bacterium]|jgi:glycosyltransferase involved in cell wall biosynthesis|nr:glycosyltransferase family 4 protein [Terriglobales bacterium]